MNAADRRLVVRFAVVIVAVAASQAAALVTLPEHRLLFLVYLAFLVALLGAILLRVAQLRRLHPAGDLRRCPGPSAGSGPTATGLTRRRAA
jgi:cytochrome c biogenesis protein CcdA